MKQQQKHQQHLYGCHRGTVIVRVQLVHMMNVEQAQAAAESQTLNISFLVKKIK